MVYTNNPIQAKEYDGTQRPVNAFIFEMRNKWMK